MYMRQSQNTSPVKLEHVCQLSHLKSKQPTKFPHLNQTTGLVIGWEGGGQGEVSLFFSFEQNLRICCCSINAKVILVRVFLLLIDKLSAFRCLNSGLCPGQPFACQMKAQRVYGNTKINPRKITRITFELFGWDYISGWQVNVYI